MRRRAFSAPMARVWLSDERLAGTATGALVAGDRVEIVVPFPAVLPASGELLAAMRIESAPLRTEHVVTTRVKVA